MEVSSPVVYEFCLGGPASPVDDPTNRGRPKCRFSTTGTENSSRRLATTPIPEPELTVEVGDSPTTGHLEETVLYSVDHYFTVQPVTPSLSASGGDHQITVPSTDPIYFYTRSCCFYTYIRDVP